MFRDITTLLQDPAAFRAACDEFYERYKDMPIDKVVGIDARGFVFGAVLAYKLNVGFVPVRKQGKLPPETVSESYTLEYGESSVEISKDAIEEGEQVLIVDDLIATGGTISAAAKLVEKLGGKIVECVFLVELPDLNGREKIKDYKIFTLTEFEGE
jgi:adenine phosphoribosyltransferase